MSVLFLDDVVGNCSVVVEFVNTPINSSTTTF